MKKILMLLNVVFLCGCIYEMPGVCTDMDEKRILCVSSADMESMKRNNFSAKDIYSFSLENDIYSYKHSCSDVSVDRTVKDQYGKRFESDKNFFLCTDDIVQDYYYAKQKKDEKRAHEERSVAIKKRFGKGLCPESIWYYLSLPTIVNHLPADCIVETGQTVGLYVSQQVPEGTLVDSQYVNTKSPLFIQKHKDISKYTASDSNIIMGYFIGTGNYTYTNILGKKMTVPKAKFLGWYTEK